MFTPRFTEDRDNVLHWLEKRGSRVVITSNLPTELNAALEAAEKELGV